MSDVLWFLLGVVLVGAPGLFALRRRARVTRTDASRHSGRCTSEAPRGIKERRAVETPAYEGTVPERAPAAQDLLEKWRSAGVSAAAKEASLEKSSGERSSPPEPECPPPVSDESACVSGNENHLLSGVEEESPLTLGQLEASLSYGAVRVRIEEARSRLKAKTFDAILKSVAKERSSQGCSDRGVEHLSADLVARIDTLLTEEHGSAPRVHRPRSARSGSRQRAQGRAKRHRRISKRTVQRRSSVSFAAGGAARRSTGLRKSRPSRDD